MRAGELVGPRKLYGCQGKIKTFCLRRWGERGVSFKAQTNTNLSRESKHEGVPLECGSGEDRNAEDSASETESKQPASKWQLEERFGPQFWKVCI